VIEDHSTAVLELLCFADSDRPLPSASPLNVRATDQLEHEIAANREEHHCYNLIHGKTYPGNDSWPGQETGRLDQDISPPEFNATCDVIKTRRHQIYRHFSPNSNFAKRQHPDVVVVKIEPCTRSPPKSTIRSPAGQS
jgi:hypothetical protein